MKNLIKYEARKGWFSKFIILIATGIFELIYLFGVFFTDMASSPAAAIGITGLSVCAVAGITFIGIQSVFTLYQDLNTKQSYMLFMTPNSSYKILGAKVIENAVSIILSGSFFAVLAGIDVSILLAKEHAITETFNAINKYLMLNIDLNEIGSVTLIAFFEIIGTWILSILIAYLAITLSSSIFAGKRYNAILCFLFFILLCVILDKTVFYIPDILTSTMSNEIRFAGVIITEFLVSAGLYFGTSFLMEKKLSV